MASVSFFLRSFTVAKPTAKSAVETQKARLRLNAFMWLRLKQLLFSSYCFRLGGLGIIGRTGKSPNEYNQDKYPTAYDSSNKPIIRLWVGFFYGRIPISVFDRRCWPSFGRWFLRCSSASCFSGNTFITRLIRYCIWVRIKIIWISYYFIPLIIHQIPKFIRIYLRPV